MHADADVAAASYDQVSPELAALASRALWPPLPCSLPCPPAEADKALRVPKTSRAYRERAGQVTAAWELVRRRCTQAERFSREIEAILPQLP